MATFGNNTFRYSLSDIDFRQQLFQDENEDLAIKLGFEDDQKHRNFDVFVTEFCDGNIKGCQKYLNSSEKKSICHQLFEGLIQLANSDKCHNDLKPENILYKLGGFVMRFILNKLNLTFSAHNIIPRMTFLDTGVPKLEFIILKNRPFIHFQHLVLY